MTATDTRNICPACNAIYAADVMVCARCGTGLLEVPDMKLLTGTTLDDRYDIEGIVGTGGMGAVYRARQRGMEREVAIKVLHPHFAADPRAVKRFFREAQSAARLVHPNIVTVYDFGRAREGHLYMVMELLEGWTLGDLIHYRAPLSPGLAIHIGAQICAALEAAEAARLVHRDLKPDNILLSATDEGFWAKVLDFGIARIARGDEDSALKRHESTVEIAGTPAYMAPEQVLGREPAPSSDLYSLGVILYEMVCRRRPFDEDTTVALCMRQMNEAPPPVTDHAKVSEPLAAVIMQLLEKKPEDRPAGASEVRARLMACPEAFIPFSRPSLVADAPRGLAHKTTRSEFGAAMSDPTLELKYLSRPHPPLADVIARSRGGLGLVMGPRPEEAAPPSAPPLPSRGQPLAVLAVLAEQGRALTEGACGRFLAELEGRGAEVLREEKVAVVRVRGADRYQVVGRILRDLASGALDLQAQALRQNAALRIGIAAVEGPRLVEAVDIARRLAADTVPGRVALAAATARAAELPAIPQTAVFLPDGSAMETVVLRDPRANQGEESSLWGRSIPLRRLGQIADEALRAGPTLALIVGSRGMGRTSVLEAFTRGRHALRVRVSPLGHGFPGHAVARLVGVALGIERLTGKASDLDAIAAISLPEEERHLLETLLLDRDPPDRLLPRGIARLVFATLLRFAAGGPLVIAFDDLQCIDEASAAVLREVVGLAAGQPWTFCGTTRHDEGPVALPGAQRLELRPLGLRPMNQLAEEIGVPQHRRHQLLALAQGNPSVLRLLAAPDGPAEAPVSLGEGLLPWLLNKLVRRATPDAADRAWVEAATGQGRAFETPLVRAARYFVEAGLTPDLTDWLARRLAWEGPVTGALATALKKAPLGARIARQARLGLHRVAAEELERGDPHRRMPAEWLQLTRLYLDGGEPARAAQAFGTWRSTARNELGGEALETLGALVEVAEGFLEAGAGAEAESAVAALRELVPEAGRQADPQHAFAVGRYFVLEARLRLADAGGRASAAALRDAQSVQEGLARIDARLALALGALVQAARADVAVAADDREAAHTNLRQARQAFRDLGRERDALRCLLNQGLLDGLSDEPPVLRRAAETLAVASRLALQGGQLGEHLQAELGLGLAELELGEVDAGTQRIRVAYRQASGQPDLAHVETHAAVAMARAMAARELAIDARRYLDRARPRTTTALGEARIAFAEGRIHRAEGQPRRAERSFVLAAEAARNAGHGVLAGVALRAAAEGVPLPVTA